MLKFLMLLLHVEVFGILNLLLLSWVIYKWANKKAHDYLTWLSFHKTNGTYGRQYTRPQSYNSWLY